MEQREDSAALLNVCLPSFIFSCCAEPTPFPHLFIPSSRRLSCSALAMLRATVNASVTLHNKLLSHILRLPKSFFDTNPAGRVLNRFSRDIETMDSVLNSNISQTCNCFATYLATLIVISYATKWFGLAVLPITAVYIILQVWACVPWLSVINNGGRVGWPLVWVSQPKVWCLMWHTCACECESHRQPPFSLYLCRCCRPAALLHPHGA